VPAFSLTKTESLYVATKFNDEARAKLVKRWYELECERMGVKAQERSFHYYALDGEKKERKYLVWTPSGMEFIRTIV